MSHEQLDALGHVGYVLLVCGQLLIAHKTTIGWPTRLIGSALWCWLGYQMDMSSIVVWSAVFLVVDVVGWARWRTKE